MLRRPGLLLLLGLLAVGCSNLGGATEGATMGFTNPVYDGSFADPQVIAVGSEYYAFATNGPLGNVQTLKSTDLVS